LNQKPALSFGSGYFSVITLPAVIEHVNPESMAVLLCDIHRFLHPGGCVILIPPAVWTSNLLHLLARLNLVNPDEIEEHVYGYTLPLIGWFFGQAGFSMGKVRFGNFELGVNLWGTAKK
jgi:hypothetical protein